MTAPSGARPQDGVAERQVARVAGEIEVGLGERRHQAFRSLDAGRFERPRRLKLNNLDARSWSYGRDVTGDGVADLVAVASKTGLHVFAGTADPRRDLLDRRPRQVIDLAALGETVSVSVGVSSEGVSTGRSASLGGPQVEDLDGNGRPEILLFSPRARGRGRVTVVRLGG